MKSVLFLIVFFVSAYTHAQDMYPYYDAFDLKSLKPEIVSGKISFSDQASTKVIAILKNYGNGADSFSSLAKAFETNPFIGLPSNIKSINVETSTGNTTAYRTAGPFGGFDVTTLADGMAQFLATRAKQELSITFFERFKEKINDPEYKDIKTLFPETYATLNVLGDQLYYYNAYLQTLRESFKRDLRDLPIHLPSVIDNHPDYFSRHPEREAMLRSGLYLYTSFNNHMAFGPILKSYPDAYLNKLNPNIKASVQTARLISESLKDTATINRPNAYWVTNTDVAKLVNDTIALKIYLGLLYQHAKNDSITFAQGITLTSVLDSVAVSYDVYSPAYRTYFLEVAEKANVLTALMDDSQTSSNDSIKIERDMQYISSSIDLLETATDVSTLGLQSPSILKLNTFFTHVQDSLSAYISTLRSAASLVCDINKRDYTSAVVHAVHLYTTTFSDTSTETSMEILKYATFMASVVEATNSDDIENAIEAAALPVGSARLKKLSSFDISLNAYVGGFWGKETDNSSGSSSTNTIYGICAPIGAAFSCSSGGWSFTFFGSFIDLGAVTAYRAQNDTVSSLPKISLANIIAPGIHAVVGIKNVPISLGIGWQVGPQLRNVTSTATEISNVQGHRWAAFVAVDIPLFDFYNTPK